MFKYSFLIFILFYLIGCKANNAQKSGIRDSSVISDTIVFKDHLIDTLSSGINFIPKGDYNQIKTNAVRNRIKFYNSYSLIQDSDEKSNLVDSARYYFTETILNEIFPHWYGTVWDFNGYTNIPKNGVVACGYFVSTTLKHMGVNMNRYKFAQQAAMNGAKTLGPDNKFSVFHMNSPDEIDTLLNMIENEFEAGLYSVGLSYHVGFLYIYDHVAYFIHSNYIDGYVMTEKARYSDAFRSNIYVITDITYNDYLIESWINNTEIPVVIN